MWLWEYSFTAEIFERTKSMNDYRELVKELKDMATYDCGFETESDVVTQAANAIESLQSEIERLKQSCDACNLPTANTALMAVNSQHRDDNAKLREADRWIPVGEMLPNGDGQTLCVVEAWNHRFIQICSFYKAFDNEELNLNNAFMDMDSEVGWYQITNITHWRPLPQPPTEIGG